MPSTTALGGASRGTSILYIYGQISSNFELVGSEKARDLLVLQAVAFIF